MRIKINKAFGKYKEGENITIKTNGDIPTSNFWRRRLRDAAIDGCCEILEEKPPKKSKKAADEDTN
jgi:hypothetical protein